MAENFKAAHPDVERVAEALDDIRKVLRGATLDSYALERGAWLLRKMSNDLAEK